MVLCRFLVEQTRAGANNILRDLIVGRQLCGPAERPPASAILNGRKRENTNINEIRAAQSDENSPATRGARRFGVVLRSMELRSKINKS